MQTYTAEETTAAESIPWDPNVKSPFQMTRSDIETGGSVFMEQMKSDLLTMAEVQGFLASAEAAGLLPAGTAAHNNANIAASGGINESIVEFGKAQAAANGTKYSLERRSQLWSYADCSSFVWGSFRHHSPPFHKTMTWSDGWPDDSATMCDKCRTGASPVQEVFTTTSTNASTRATVITPKLNLMVKGDLIFRRRGQVAGNTVGHVAFVYSNDPAGKRLELCDAAGKTIQVGPRGASYDYVSTHYTDCWRPMLGAPDLSGNRAVPTAGAT